MQNKDIQWTEAAKKVSLEQMEKILKEENERGATINIPEVLESLKAFQTKYETN